MKPSVADFGGLENIFRSFQGSLIVESDSYNAISWVIHDRSKPWKLQFCFNKDKDLVNHNYMVFHHKVWSANRLADSLAK